MLKNAEMIMEFIFYIQLDASVAQMVVHQTSDQKVVSSNPTGSRILLFLFCYGFTNSNKPDHGAMYKSVIFGKSCLVTTFLVKSQFAVVD
jgi:hypothetical protein